MPNIVHRIGIEGSTAETVLLFRHCGWRAKAEFLHHCSTRWAWFLIGLKQLLETGRGRQYGPGFEPISRWPR
jgi:hypothetical protein